MHMRERHIYAGASCAGVVSAGVTCFIVGFVMLVWGIWDILYSLANDVMLQGIVEIVLLSVVVWLFSWVFLYMAWKIKPIRPKTAFRLARLLIIAGIGSSFLAMIQLLFS